MLTLTVQPSRVEGGCTAPPSKSHTLRAILFATMAEGISHIYRPLPSPDTDAMISACRLLGATIEHKDDTLTIKGINGQPQLPGEIIDAGNSGQVLRFIGAITGLIDGSSVITGDHSIQYNRPAQALLDGLNGLGAEAVSTKKDGRAPLIIKGLIQPGRIEIDGQDSQPVSALLMAATFLPGRTDITIRNPGEKPWVALTLDWFDHLGIAYKNKDFTHYTLPGHTRLKAFDYTVPGDYSGMAYPVVAALLSQSTLTMDNLDPQDSQGDKSLIDSLIAMGANIQFDGQSLVVEPSGTLKGIDIDMQACIDAIPILAVLGCFTQGEMLLKNAGIARQKECDRLSVMTQSLRKMGADITETEDTLCIRPAALHYAVLDSHHDHRIAMALAVAGLHAKGCEINNVQCINKSFPNFVPCFKALGADVEVHA